VRSLLLAAGAAGTAWSLPALSPIVPPLSDAFGIERVMASGEPAVALTFDDGPHPLGTPAILELLAAADARATFFLVGEQVRRWPGVAAEIAAAGHTIALHGDRHRSLLRIPPRALAADLDRGHAEIASATGIAPSRYRPPYGIFTPAGLAVARRRGWTPTLWSRWGRDWRRFIAPTTIARMVTADLGPGDVLLLHDSDNYSARDSWRRTVAALPLVLAEIERRGLRSVGL
jgi:peptidoglycan/xylan/chitin deacetylase (PgdA/CDA1 family)